MIGATPRFEKLVILDITPTDLRLIANYLEKEFNTQGLGAELPHWDFNSNEGTVRLIVDQERIRKNRG